MIKYSLLCSNFNNLAHLGNFCTGCLYHLRTKSFTKVLETENFIQVLIQVLIGSNIHCNFLEYKFFLNIMIQSIF